MLVGEYFARYYRGRYYGKAQNQARRLRAAYDEVLARYDLLLMPTMPMKAPPLPPSDAPLSLYLQRSFEFLVNTPSFDVTHHPAMTLPCGLSDGLPIGMMLVANISTKALFTAPRTRSSRPARRYEGSTILFRFASSNFFSGPSALIVRSIGRLCASLIDGVQTQPEGR